jgi:hypothetical protein
MAPAGRLHSLQQVADHVRLDLRTLRIERRVHDLRLGQLHAVAKERNPVEAGDERQLLRANRAGDPVTGEALISSAVSSGAVIIDVPERGTRE